jgi:type II secretion system protein H
VERARGGFTLIEIIVVCAIMALLVAIMVPALDGATPGHRLDASAREVAATIEWAQGDAAANDAEYAIGYDLDTHRYWLVLPREEAADEGTGEAGGEAAAEDEPEDYAARETLGEESLRDGIEFVSIETADGEEHTSGQVYVPLSPLGNEGSHIVVLRCAPESGGGGGELQQSIRFNALTRSIDYVEGAIRLRRLEGEGGSP